MKLQVQPLTDLCTTKAIKSDVVVTAKPATATKSRLKRMLERQFPSVLRSSSSEKVDETQCMADAEPSSVCLDKMVQNFIEDSEKQTKCGLSRCNCFNGNGSDGSDEDQDAGDSSFSSVSEIVRGLVPCASVTERNLLADTARIEESKIKSFRRNASLTALVVEGLIGLGYDASVCKSKWDQSSSYPAGEYEYIDVIVAVDEGGGTDRLIVDIDFKSEFEIARSTSQYRGVLQSLPTIFVGKSDRLLQIISLVSDAARQSLKKKGLHFPPWRKPEYMRAKWLSPYERTKPNGESEEEIKKIPAADPSVMAVKHSWISTSGLSAEFEMRFGSNHASGSGGGDGNRVSVVVTEWTPPAFEPKRKEGKIVTGLASVLRDIP